MNLVSYSDSEGSNSDSEFNKPVEVSKFKLGAPVSSKPAFQKVVDRSNPHKIRVNLATTSVAGDDDQLEREAPPAKRARTTQGRGLFSGIDSFLPAPKRSGDSPAGNLSGRRGLGAGVNLKTGATPAFSRERPPQELSEELESELEQQQEQQREQEPREDHELRDTAQRISDEKFKPEEVKLVGKTTIFKPLSVARNAQKKKKKVFTSAAGSHPHQQQQQQQQQQPAIVPSAHAPHAHHVPPPPPKPKVSLFSISQESSAIEASTYVESSKEYTPIIIPTSYERELELDQEQEWELERDQDEESLSLNKSFAADATQSNLNVSHSGPETLSSLAESLNLPASARRQLLGRHRQSVADVPITLVNFNTDTEYAANEEIRAKGDTIQHNPLRAIAPGKHSLKQLVNAASTQKDALEESFASGRRNQKEAGNRYGW